MVLVENILFKETEVLYFQFSDCKKKSDHTSETDIKVLRIGNTTRMIWKSRVEVRCFFTTLWKKTGEKGYVKKLTWVQQYLSYHCSTERSQGSNIKMETLYICNVLIKRELLSTRELSIKIIYIHIYIFNKKETTV